MEPTEDDVPDSQLIQPGDRNRTQEVDLQPEEKRDLTRQSKAPNPHETKNGIAGESAISGFFHLYRWHPFTELFCVIAEWFEDGETDISQRSAFAQKYAKTFMAAVVLDFLVLLFIVVTVLLAIGILALRAAGIEIEVVKVYVPWFR